VPAAGEGKGGAGGGLWSRRLLWAPCEETPSRRHQVGLEGPGWGSAPFGVGAWRAAGSAPREASAAGSRQPGGAMRGAGLGDREGFRVENCSALVLTSSFVKILYKECHKN